MENKENLSKNYAFGDSPDEAIKALRDNFQEGKKWCLDSAEHWAEIKSFHLPKEMILFNLGLLAFLGAMNNSFTIVSFLYFALALSGVSILLSFHFVWVVINENINSVNKREKIFDDALSGFLNKKPLNYILGDYNSKMSEVFGRMRAKDKCYLWFQKISICSFILALAFGIIGILTK